MYPSTNSLKWDNEIIKATLKYTKLKVNLIEINNNIKCLYYIHLNEYIKWI